MHQHDCPLCDKESYGCENYGCEELTSNVCPDCLDDIEDTPQQVKNS